MYVRECVFLSIRNREFCKLYFVILGTDVKNWVDAHLYKHVGIPLVDLNIHILCSHLKLHFVC